MTMIGRAVTAAIFSFLRSLALYLAVVVGGVTLFLVLVPLLGYLPYSDRPGPGWYGVFPALGWYAFWKNAGEMLGYGLFLGLLFIVPGAVALLIIRGIERWLPFSTVVRILEILLAALFAGGWMLSAGWYIAAGWPLVALALVLGAVAGAWVIPMPRKVVP